MNNNYYQSNSLKISIWLIILVFAGNSFYNYLYLNTISVFTIGMVFMGTILEIIYSIKPIISITPDAIIIYGSPGVHPIFQNLHIPMNSIIKTEVRGNSYWNKKFILVYHDQNNAEKIKMIYFGQIKNADQLQQQLTNLHIPSTIN